MNTLISDVISVIEAVAPLRFQEDFDNAGLQTGFPRDELRGVLVCLDVTEAVVEEAAALGCNLIVSHHPLLFKALKQVSDRTYQQRCVVNALSHGISVYSAHTNLDNAPGGVNFRIASLLGLEDVHFLQVSSDGVSGSGVVGTLPEPQCDAAFVSRLAGLFDVRCVRHTALTGASIRKVALCGGAGAFLMKDAMAAGADCYMTGELHYHDFFEGEGMLLVSLGHYQSERCVIDLLYDIIRDAFPAVPLRRTTVVTCAECYTC